MICLAKVDEAEKALREAHQAATESECHGILYRLDRHLAKLKIFRNYLRFKRGRLEKRMEVLRGN